jgi:UDP-2,4-diacetamido-2,4,6-trideoxy-beta-L-altropyranose hydrolase
MKRVVFRVDSSLVIGSGHVMRCSVLAEQLVKYGFDILFICRNLDGALLAFIASKFKLIIINCTKKTNNENSVYKFNQLSDAIDTIKHLNEHDIVVVDHYGLDILWEKKISEHKAISMVVIDDLNRKHKSDLLIDQNLLPDQHIRYLGHTGKKLLGPKYCLLREEFSLLRNKQVTLLDQVLVFFGGSDPTSECTKFIKALDYYEPKNFTIKLITGSQNKTSITSEVSWGCILSNSSDFAVDIKKSKYLIGAGGSTNWERLCLNKNFTIVAVAENQVEQAEYLDLNGFARYLGKAENVSVVNYINELKRLDNNWHYIRDECNFTIDGLGARRVATCIEELYSGQN